MMDLPFAYRSRFSSKSVFAYKRMRGTESLKMLKVNCKTCRPLVCA